MLAQVLLYQAAAQAQIWHRASVQFCLLHARDAEAPEALAGRDRFLCEGAGEVAKPAIVQKGPSEAVVLAKVNRSVMQQRRSPPCPQHL